MEAQKTFKTLKEILVLFFTGIWIYEEDSRYHSRIIAFIGFSIIMCLGGILWGTICLANGCYGSSLIPYGYSILVFPAILLTLNKPKLFKKLANFQLFLSLLLPFLLQWALGGYSHSGTVMLWSLSALIGSIMIVGPRNSTLWYWLYVGLVITSAAIDMSLVAPFEIDMQNSPLFAINIVSVSTMIYFVSRVFIHKNEVNRKHLSKSLKDLTAQLEKLYDERINEEKFSALGKIAANIGHEINNPLTISTANLDKLEFLLNSNEFNQRDIERTVKNLKVANNRIQRITKGLKTYSRSSCHEMVPVNLNLATQQAVDLIDDMYLKEGVVVKYRFNDENINILGDLGKFQQILFNLIQNAKDATEGYDDRSIDISLQVNRNSKKVKLYVADNGCGIPEDVLPKIFEPLFTTKKIGKGTGLGLGIVSQLVFEMKGDIKVDTRPHSGTTFKIEFPLIEVESSLSTDPTTELGKEKNQNHIKLSAKSKILVVDDESEIRAFLQEVLESYEFVVECAGDEVEARRAIRKHDFDIVFTDLKMLGFDGIEFSKEVKRVNQETKVVLMTGMVLNASQRKARTVDFHLEKPFDLETLIQFISEKEKFQNNNKSVA